MDVGPAFVTDAQAAVLMQPGEGALDDPPLVAQTRSVLGLALGDYRPDPTGAQFLSSEPALRASNHLCARAQLRRRSLLGRAVPHRRAARPAPRRRSPFVYEHAAELGALRLGAGPGARLRFRFRGSRTANLLLVSRESCAADPAPKTAKRPRGHRRMGTSVELLPIRGRIERS